MKIEIWSDVVCPFCYIGKRHFEAALRDFKDRANLDIVWKSYMLDPDAPAAIHKPYAQALAERKGFPADKIAGMFQQVTQMARAAGLDFHLEKALAANTFKAHQMIQLAKTKDLGDAMEEVLFRAFFTEGKDIGDEEVLTRLGLEAGLDKAEISAAFANETYAQNVYSDLDEAQQLGISGVPFFVLDRKYGVSGAQPVEVFLKSLEKAFDEWRTQNPEMKLEVEGGPACTPDGFCG